MNFKVFETQYFKTHVKFVFGFKNIIINFENFKNQNK